MKLRQFFNQYEAVKQLNVASCMHNWCQNMRGKRQDRKKYFNIG